MTGGRVGEPAGGPRDRIRKQRRAKRDAFDQGGFVTPHTLVFTVVSLTYSCSIVTEQEGLKKEEKNSLGSLSSAVPRPTVSLTSQRRS